MPTIAMHSREHARVNAYAASIALLWMAALAIPRAVSAADSASEVVSVKDLDLRSDQGRGELRSRMLIVAKRLCSRFRNTARIDDRENFFECIRGIKVETKK